MFCAVLSTFPNVRERRCGRKKRGMKPPLFAGRLNADGQEYAVGFVLREDGNGKRFYDHELTRIIDPSSLNSAGPSKEEARTETRANRGLVSNNVAKPFRALRPALGRGLHPLPSYRPKDTPPFRAGWGSIGLKAEVSNHKGSKMNILRDTLGVNDGTGTLFSAEREAVRRTPRPGELWHGGRRASGAWRQA